MIDTWGCVHFLTSRLCCVSQVTQFPPSQSCPPPVWSWSRERPHSCVWPTRASPQTGLCAGKWTVPVGARAWPGAWGSWGMTACTAGAAPWLSVRTTGWRRGHWPVRPQRAPCLPPLRHWAEPNALSRAGGGPAHTLITLFLPCSALILSAPYCCLTELSLCVNPSSSLSFQC